MLMSINATPVRSLSTLSLSCAFAHFESFIHFSYNILLNYALFDGSRLLQVQNSSFLHCGNDQRQAAFAQVRLIINYIVVNGLHFAVFAIVSLAVVIAKCYSEATVDGAMPKATGATCERCSFIVHFAAMAATNTVGHISEMESSNFVPTPGGL